MLRESLYEKINFVCLIIICSLLLGGILYLILGAVIKRHGIKIKTLLIIEEYTFSVVASIIIFLCFSFPFALILWSLLYVLMHFHFKSNLLLVNYILYCEQNELKLDRWQAKLFSQINTYVISNHLTFWLKEYRLTKAACVNKLDDLTVKQLKIKNKILPSDLFFSGTVGVAITLFTYENVFDGTYSFLHVLIENYAILSCLLYALYILLYCSCTLNRFHYMYKDKKTLKILFTIFSMIMYTAITVISTVHFKV